MLLNSIQKRGTRMKYIFSAILKAFNILTELPIFAIKAFQSKQKKRKLFDSRTYGGFTQSDWDKIGHDIKRGLKMIKK